jgi:hypothetical protein
MMPTTKPTLPIFSTATALNLLWRKAAPELHVHELEWVAGGALSQVASDSLALSQVLSELGCLVLADAGATGSFTDADSTSTLMFNLSSQLSALGGMADIAADATDRVRLALGGQQ